VGKLIVASAAAQRPPGRESRPIDEDRMPRPATRRPDQVLALITSFLDAA
jgi:hypothetical protein